MAKGLGARIVGLFKKHTESEELLEGLEELLIEGDFGVHATMEIVDSLREKLRFEQVRDSGACTAALKELLAPQIATAEMEFSDRKLNLVLVLGVNGVGKTTSIAKLAHHLSADFGIDKIVLSAGDTFRAGAIDQIRVLGERLGARVVSQEPGADPGSVVYDTIESAKAHGERLILADTAGRMHNKAHLVRELEKIDKIVRKRLTDGRYHKMLVVDATTGQNCLRQAEIFHDAIGLDSLFLAKYDSSSKGGMVVAISKSVGIPVSFLGVGEKPTDIRVFNVDEYLSDLLGVE